MGFFEDLGNFFNPTVDYNSFYDEQAELYKQEMRRRNQQFETNDKLSSNAAAVNLLVGGNKPIGGNGGTGPNFQALQDEFAKMVSGTTSEQAASGSNLTGLSGDTLDNQKRANQQIVDRDFQNMIRNIDLSNIIIGAI